MEKFTFYDRILDFISAFFSGWKAIGMTAIIASIWRILQKKAYEKWKTQHCVSFRTLWHWIKASTNSIITALALVGGFLVVSFLAFDEVNVHLHDALKQHPDTEALTKRTNEQSKIIDQLTAQNYPPLSGDEIEVWAKELSPYKDTKSKELPQNVWVTIHLSRDSHAEELMESISRACKKASINCAYSNDDIGFEGFHGMVLHGDKRNPVFPVLDKLIRSIDPSYVAHPDISIPQDPAFYPQLQIDIYKRLP